MHAVCELGEDVRDAVVQYQVSSGLLVLQGCVIESASSWLNRPQYTNKIVD